MSWRAMQSWLQGKWTERPEIVGRSVGEAPISLVWRMTLVVAGEVVVALGVCSAVVWMMSVAVEI